MGSKKVVIVEDDHFLSSVLKSRLEKEGFLVLQAFDGDEGLVMVRKEKPDVVLLDLIMPKMSGFEFLQALSMNPQLKSIPVIVLSNLAQESDIQKAKTLGVQQYFVKVRISVDDIVSRVKELIK